MSDRKKESEEPTTKKSIEALDELLTSIPSSSKAEESGKEEPERHNRALDTHEIDHPFSIEECLIIILNSSEPEKKDEKFLTFLHEELRYLMKNDITNKVVSAAPQSKSKGKTQEGIDLLALERKIFIENTLQVRDLSTIPTELLEQFASDWDKIRSLIPTNEKELKALDMPNTLSDKGFLERLYKIKVLSNSQAQSVPDSNNVLNQDNDKAGPKRGRKSGSIGRLKRAARSMILGKQKE